MIFIIIWLVEWAKKRRESSWQRYIAVPVMKFAQWLCEFFKDHIGFVDGAECPMCHKIIKRTPNGQ